MKFFNQIPQIDIQMAFYLFSCFWGKNQNIRFRFLFSHNHTSSAGTKKHCHCKTERGKKKGVANQPCLIDMAASAT